MRLVNDDSTCHPRRLLTFEEATYLKTTPNMLAETGSTMPLCGQWTLLRVKCYNCAEGSLEQGREPCVVIRTRGVEGRGPGVKLC